MQPKVSKPFNTGVYINGFNLYCYLRHILCKWLDLKKLVENIIDFAFYIKS